MANKERGETTLTVGDQTYTLRLNIDSICQMEAELDRSFGSIILELADPSEMRVATARALLWAALLEHHPVTVKEAGELMLKAGGVVKVLTVLSEAVKQSFPIETTAEGSANGRRPTRAVGIGRNS